MKSEEAQIKGPRLEKPLRITEQVWPEGTVPVVSICCITYQHVNFIRDAIEGFLMQETTFPVEIIIRDDASSDGTAEIVREYQEKYPQLIRTILHAENQFSKGKKAFPETRAMARGEFIALCEGDDYWIHKNKLEKQIELLRLYPEATLSFTNAWACHDGESRKDWLFCQHLPKDVILFTLEDLLVRRWFVATATIVFRASVLGLQKLSLFAFGGDLIVQLSAGVVGSLVYLDQISTVYRRHPNSMAHSLYHNQYDIYEKYKPNYLFTLWALSDCALLTESQIQARDERVKVTLKEICQYLLRRESVCEFPSSQQIKNALLEILQKNLPVQISASELAVGSRLNRFMDESVAFELCRNYKDAANRLAIKGNALGLISMLTIIARKRILPLADSLDLLIVATVRFSNYLRRYLFGTKASSECK